MHQRIDRGGFLPLRNLGGVLAPFHSLREVRFRVFQDLSILQQVDGAQCDDFRRHRGKRSALASRASERVFSCKIGPTITGYDSTGVLHPQD